MLPICYILIVIFLAGVLIIAIPFTRMLWAGIPPSFKIECLIVTFAAIFIWLPILNIFHALYCAKVIKEHCTKVIKERTNKMMQNRI